MKYILYFWINLVVMNKCKSMLKLIKFILLKNCGKLFLIDYD